MILEHANLEVAQTKKGVELINSDDHQRFIEQKLQQDVEDFRPDIVHQCLMALLDSPLSKAGRLNVIIRTKKGVLIKVSPEIRLPRTYKRFSGLMAQLLTKMRIRSPEDKTTLLEIVNGPIESHLPPGALVIGTSTKGHLVPDLDKYFNEQQTRTNNLVFMIGCTSYGHHAYESELVHDCISISHYSLSAQAVCQRVCFSAEEIWNVVGL